jgi:hypothetical protein
MVFVNAKKASSSSQELKTVYSANPAHVAVLRA